MNRTLMTIALLAASAGFSTAQAQTYVGGSVGQTESKEECFAGLTCDQKETGYKIFAGHMFTPYLGMEVAYLDHGTVSFSDGVDTLEFMTNGFGLWAKAALPVGRLSLFAKAGIAYLDTKVRLLGVAEEYQSATSLAWGAGASFSVTQSVGVRVEFERFRPEYLGEKVDLDFISAGVTYRF